MPIDKTPENLLKRILAMTPSSKLMNEFELGQRFGGIEAKLEAGNRRFESLASQIEKLDKKVDTTDEKIDTVTITIERMESKMWRAVAFSALAAAAGGAGLNKLLGLIF